MAFPLTHRVNKHREQWIIYLVLVILIIVLSAIMYRYQRDVLFADMQKEHQRHITVAATSISRDLGLIRSDIEYVASLDALTAWLERGDAAHRNQLISLWQHFLEHKKLYSQIRFIDITGEEQIRLDYRAGRSILVPADELQNKRHRSYFKDSLQLEHNQLYLSRFDLNQEEGKVERPLNPTLRMTRAVYDVTGKRYGFVILNYRGQAFLDSIRKDTSASFWLVNASGYWLLHEQPEKLWGRDLGHDAESLPNRHPELWRRMQESASGSVRVDNRYWTFTRINMARILDASSTADNTPALLTDEQYWWLINNTDSAVYGRHLSVYRISAVSICLLMLLAISFYFRALMKKYSEKEQRELYIRAVIDTATDAIITINKQGNIKSFNPAAEQMFGYKAAEVIGDNVSILTTDGHHDQYLHNYLNTGVRRILDTGRELRARKKDGSLFDIELKVSEIKLPNHHEFAGFIRDISIRKELEQKQTYLHHRLELSHKELERFAYITSHDLQEPLRTISSFIQLLEQDYAESIKGEGQQYLKFIHDSSERMRVLINELLDYHRIGRTRIRTMVNLSQLLEQVRQDMNYSILQTDAKLVVRNLPVVSGYETELRLLFQNLISNAIKFRLPDITPRILIESVSTDDGPEFRISDNGIGIEKKYQQRVFDLFQRLHHRDTYEGTGMGLAICKKIIELHGGRIWIEDGPGTGTMFCFTLSGNSELMEEEYDNHA